jgi:glutamate/tyrosine decarboxylase-like PLP-dependent enzyme
MDALAEVVARNCRQAALLGRTVSDCDELELMAPVSLNIVCFRYVARGLGDDELDALNTEIVTALQTQGIAAPSTTRLRGRVAIRVCLVNHRTTTEDLDILVRAVRRLGGERVAMRGAGRPS